MMPASIIRKACDLKIAHAIHIWQAPFLDGHVRYFCDGLTQSEVEFLDLLTSCYGKDF